MVIFNFLDQGLGSFFPKMKQKIEYLSNENFYINEEKEYGIKKEHT